jgi:hypothetical protein
VPSWSASDPTPAAAAPASPTAADRARRLLAQLFAQPPGGYGEEETPKCDSGTTAGHDS